MSVIATHAQAGARAARWPSGRRLLGHRVLDRSLDGRLRFRGVGCRRCDGGGIRLSLRGGLRGRRLRRRLALAYLGRRIRLRLPPPNLRRAAA